MKASKQNLDFTGQNIYIGIDVHLKSWAITILTETISHKRFTQPPRAEVLVAYLHKHFPNATYHSAYEAGFSGFEAHFELIELGVNNIVINPADVPTTQKEMYQKNDSVDSLKIAKSLRSGELRALHILSQETLEDRSLIRMRSNIVKDMTRFKSRIKSFLYFHGIDYPEEFMLSKSHWTLRFIKWLKEDIKMKTDSGAFALNSLIAEVDTQRKILLDVNRKIRNLANGERYGSSFNLLKSVPGIGLVSGITLLTQIEDISRFPNSDHFASYVGLIPNTYSSGEKEVHGELTIRGIGHLKHIIVESAWVAVRVDSVLALAYNKYCQRMSPNKAIIRIARKLLNRIFFVLKNKQEYEIGIVE